jgi:hypothetical protein
MGRGMDLGKAPLIIVIIFIEMIVDGAILLAVSAATTSLSYSLEFLILAAIVIIALEVWLDLKYLI